MKALPTIHAPAELAAINATLAALKERQRDTSGTPVRLALIDERDRLADAAARAWRDKHRPGAERTFRVAAARLLIIDRAMQPTGAQPWSIGHALAQLGESAGGVAAMLEIDAEAARLRAELDGRKEAPAKAQDAA